LQRLDLPQESGVGQVSTERITSTDRASLYIPHISTLFRSRIRFFVFLHANLLGGLVMGETIQITESSYCFRTILHAVYILKNLMSEITFDLFTFQERSVRGHFKTDIA
jgi:hypothetical protein